MKCAFIEYVQPIQSYKFVRNVISTSHSGTLVFKAFEDELRSTKNRTILHFVRVAHWKAYTFKGS